jgi:hypothetical protein
MQIRLRMPLMLPWASYATQVYLQHVGRRTYTWEHELLVGSEALGEVKDVIRVRFESSFQRILARRRGSESPDFVDLPLSQLILSDLCHR